LGKQKARKKQKRRAALSSATQFEAVAREWQAKQKAKWSEHRAADIVHGLEADVFRYLGATPIADIEVTDVLTVLRRMEMPGVHELARRASSSSARR